MSLGASAAVARPLFRDNFVAERRHVAAVRPPRPLSHAYFPNLYPQPVARRQEAASASAVCSICLNF